MAVEQFDKNTIKIRVYILIWTKEIMSTSFQEGKEAEKEMRDGWYMVKLK